VYILSSVSYFCRYFCYAWRPTRCAIGAAIGNLFRLAGASNDFEELQIKSDLKESIEFIFPVRGTVLWNGNLM
jgi:hypothetical protein